MWVDGVLENILSIFTIFTDFKVFENSDDIEIT